jgi:cytochrome P450
MEGVSVNGRDMVNDFDLDSEEFAAKYDRLVEELPVKCPVLRSNVGTGYYVLTRYDDVRSAGQDWRTFSSAQGFIPNRPEGMELMYPNEADPPYHTQWRRVLNPHFGPEAVEAYRDQIAAIMNAHIDTFIDRGECELVSEFAYPIPGAVFFTCFLGLPAESAAEFQTAAYAALSGPVEGRGTGFAEIRRLCGELLAQRKDELPQGDLISTVLSGVDYEGQPCPWEHKIAVLADVVLGGIATTAYVMAAMSWHLALHPEDRERLVAHPDLRESAVEEYLRYFTVVTMSGRAVTKDTILAGHEFRKGDFVMLAYSSSSRDAAAFENPGQIEIDRQTNRHGAFGFGPHRCLGANLARFEIAMALDIILARMPAFRLRDGFTAKFEAGMNRHLNELQLVWKDAS